MIKIITNKKGLGNFAMFAATLTFAIAAGFPAWNSGKVGVKDGVPGEYAVELHDVDMEGKRTAVKYASDINS